MTLFQFYKEFDTEKKCIDYFIKVRWGNDVKCPFCGHGKYYRIQNYSTKKDKKFIPRFKCANNKCYKKFSATSGTIFHAANVPLSQFFYLLYSTAMNKKNVSSVQQSLNLGVMQKTTWYIMMRIRMLCYQDPNLKLSGTVEVDETYLAKGKWKHYGKYTSGRKIPVLGLLERGGKVVVKVIHSKDKKTVQDVILNHVKTDSKVYTDGAGCYSNLNSYFKHDSVNHKAQEWVRGDVYTNGIENFWTQVKGAIRGAHGSVSTHHLQRYCDEVAYRWNNKHMTSLERFNDLLKRGCLSKPIGNKYVILNVRHKNQAIANDYIEEKELTVSKKMVIGIISCYKREKEGYKIEFKDAKGSFVKLLDRGLIIKKDSNSWVLSQTAIELASILN